MRPVFLWSATTRVSQLSILGRTRHQTYHHTIYIFLIFSKSTYSFNTKQLQRVAHITRNYRKSSPNCWILLFTITTSSTTLRVSRQPWQQYIIDKITVYTTNAMPRQASIIIHNVIRKSWHRSFNCLIDCTYNCNVEVIR